MRLYTPNTVFNFGKHKGESLIKVAKNDPDYINWCLKNLDHFVIDDGTVDVLYRNSNFHLTQEADEIRSEKLKYFYGGEYCSADEYDIYNEPSDDFDWDEANYYTMTEGEFGDYDELPDDFDFDNWRTAMGLD